MAPSNVKMEDLFTANSFQISKLDSAIFSRSSSPHLLAAAGALPLDGWGSNKRT